MRRERVIMKRIFKSKAFVIAIACLLLVGVFAGVSALADANQVTVKTTAVGLNYDGAAKLAYTVEIANGDASGEAKMYFWTEFPGETVTAEAVLAAGQDWQEINFVDGKWTVSSPGFAPKKMTQVIYAGAVYTDESGTYYGNVVRASVLEYLMAMANKGGTEMQEGLWQSMTEYVQYVQDYLGYDLTTNADELCFVQVVGGRVKGDDVSGGGLYKAGQLTLVSDGAENFVCWRGEDYSRVGTTAELEITVEAGKSYVYRAVNEVNVTVETKLPDALSAATDNLALAYDMLAPLTQNDTDGSKYPYFRTDVNGGNTAVEGAPSLVAKKFGRAAVAAQFKATVNETPVYFSHWEDESGNIVSELAAFTFDTKAEDVKYYAVYTDEAPVADGTWTTATQDKTVGGVKYTDVSGIANGSFTYGRNGSTALGNTVKAQNQGVWTEGDSRIVLSFDLTVTGIDENTQAGNFHFQVASASVNTDTQNNVLMFGFLAHQNIKEGDEVVDTGHVLGFENREAITGQNDKAQGYMYNHLLKYGEEYHIDIELQVAKQTNGKYVVEGYSFYVDGVYVGSASVKTCDTVDMSGDIWFNFIGWSGSKGFANVKNATVVCD